MKKFKEFIIEEYDKSHGYHYAHGVFDGMVSNNEKHFKKMDELIKKTSPKLD